MKKVFVTGGASGLGKFICDDLAKKGYKVFAGDIDIEALKNINNENITPIYIDIANEESIKNAYNKVIQETNNLDAIINNAGIAFMDSLIEANIDMIKRVFDINIMGMIMVNKIFFPLIEKNKGRIINISSENGWMEVAPFNGPYAISKHAVEAYSDGLRRELNYIGIKVIKIQPGSFKTNMHIKTVENFNMLKEKTTLFKSNVLKMEKSMNRELGNANDPKYFIEVVNEALEKPNPKSCYRVKNSPTMVLMNKFSSKFLDKLYLKALK